MTTFFFSHFFINTTQNGLHVNVNKINKTLPTPKRSIDNLTKKGLPYRKHFVSLHRQSDNAEARRKWVLLPSEA